MAEPYKKCSGVLPGIDSAVRVRQRIQRYGANGRYDANAACSSKRRRCCCPFIVCTSFSISCGVWIRLSVSDYSALIVIKPGQDQFKSLAGHGLSIRISECVPLLRMILIFQFAKKHNGRRIASTRQNVHTAQVGAGLFLRRTARWGTIFHAAQSRQCSHGVHVFQIGYLPSLNIPEK